MRFRVWGPHLLPYDALDNPVLYRTPCGWIPQGMKLCLSWKLLPSGAPDGWELQSEFL